MSQPTTENPFQIPQRRTKQVEQASPGQRIHSELTSTNRIGHGNCCGSGTTPHSIAVHTGFRFHSGTSQHVSAIPEGGTLTAQTRTLVWPLSLTSGGSRRLGCTEPFLINDETHLQESRYKHAGYMRGSLYQSMCTAKL